MLFIFLRQTNKISGSKVFNLITNIHLCLKIQFTLSLVKINLFIYLFLKLATDNMFCNIIVANVKMLV